MITFPATYSQFRTQDKIYLLKQSSPDNLLVRVYLQEPYRTRPQYRYTCLFKERFKISDLKLPKDFIFEHNPYPILCALGTIDSISREHFGSFVEPKRGVTPHEPPFDHIINSRSSLGPVPQFSESVKLNDQLALSNAQEARAYAAQGEYQEALAVYTKMLEHTQDPKLYEEIVNLFVQMRERGKVMLSRLYLAKYQFWAKNEDAALATLSKVHGTSRGSVDIACALADFYLHRNEMEKATALLEEYENILGKEDLSKLTEFGYKLVRSYPNQLLFYELLSNWEQDKDKSLSVALQGVCAAIQEKNVAAALRLCPKRDRIFPFVDELLKLATLDISGQRDRILPELSDIVVNSRRCSSNSGIFQRKVLKHIAYLNPTNENFQKALGLISNMRNENKLINFYYKWLEQMVKQEKWPEAESVAFELKKIKNDHHTINEHLETIYNNFEGHKLEQIYLDLGYAYKEKKQWDQMERVYKLGCEKFKSFESTYGLAKAFEYQSKAELAVKQFYTASRFALIEDKDYGIGDCLTSIKHIDPQFKYLDENQQMHLLTQGKIVKLLEQTQPPLKKPSYRAHAAAWPRLIESGGMPEIAFGAKKWKQHFNSVVEEPPIPLGIYAALKGPCPFWPGKRVEETHILTLIPAKLGSRPFSLSVSQINPQSFQNIDCRTSPKSSYWVLMTREILEETKNLDYEGAVKVLEGMAKGHPYEVPEVLEVFTAMRCQYRDTEEHLFGGREERKGKFTWCKDKTKDGKHRVRLGKNPSSLGSMIFTATGESFGTNTGIFPVRKL